ncbi:hypothetical protein MPH_13855, partial [Macrophomina phaseolina MS6]
KSLLRSSLNLSQSLRLFPHHKHRNWPSIGRTISTSCLQLGHMYLPYRAVICLTIFSASSLQTVGEPIVAHKRSFPKAPISSTVSLMPSLFSSASTWSDAIFTTESRSPRSLQGVV